ncbi:unnamed protein product [Symbiodinium sp. CCMP2592]|nr:unnamed protein product [Symbiodinium sp. CCMP2592]
MASALPQRPISLAQSLHEDTLDGAITLEETISNTEGLKVIFLEKPMIVHKPVGSVKIGDLPARDEIVDALKKKIQFLDVILNHKDIKIYPEPLKMKGNNLTPYTMQVFMLQSEDKTWNIVKHVRFAEGNKILASTIISMCTGRPLEIDYRKNFRDGTRALQYMLEGLGGFQVRYQKLVPLNASNKVPKETEDIRKGFQFLKEHVHFWTEEQVNNPDSILYKWDRGTIKEFLRCQADKGAQADTISDWPLTLADFTPWALNTVIAPLLPYLIEHAVIWIGKSEVGKSPASYTLSHFISAFWLLQEGRTDELPCFQTASFLDYFRKERGRRSKPRVFDDGNFYLETPAAVKAITEVSGIDRKTMARYNASSYAKNQLCQACSNPYDRTGESKMRPGIASDTVSFDDFYKLVRPSFHRDFDEEDLLAVFKRSCIVAFTEIGIYIRTPGTSRDPVPRHAWPDRDCGMVSPCARPLFQTYKHGGSAGNVPEHAQKVQWSLNFLQAALDGEALPRCSTIFGKNFDGEKYVIEVRPTLAGISVDSTFYPDKIAQPNEPAKKRFRSVKSSSALISNFVPKPEDKGENIKEDDGNQEKKEDIEEATSSARAHVTIKQEPLKVKAKFTAFKTSLKGRTMHISLSDPTPPSSPKSPPKAATASTSLPPSPRPPFPKSSPVHSSPGEAMEVVDPMENLSQNLEAFMDDA